MDEEVHAVLRSTEALGQRPDAVATPCYIYVTSNNTHMVAGLDGDDRLLLLLLSDGWVFQPRDQGWNVLKCDDHVEHQDTRQLGEKHSGCVCLEGGGSVQIGIAGDNGSLCDAEDVGDG